MEQFSQQVWERLERAEARVGKLEAALRGAKEVLLAWGDWVNERDMVESHSQETGVSEEWVAKLFDQIQEALVKSVPANGEGLAK